MSVTDTSIPLYSRAGNNSVAGIIIKLRWGITEVLARVIQKQANGMIG